MAALVLDSCLCLNHRSSHGLTKGVVGNCRQVLDGRVDFEQFTPTRLQTPNCGSVYLWKKLRSGGGWIYSSQNIMFEGTVKADVSTINIWYDMRDNHIRRDVRQVVLLGCAVVI
jgi:hypothetical protein